MNPGTLCFTVDVEEWFQAENLRVAHPPDSWDHRESRVEKSTHAVMDVLEERGVRGTFFVLGWVARKKPGLVKTLAERGHEVASHGLGHIIHTSLSHRELQEDVSGSKKLLEDLTGLEVAGYRAPCFSVSDALMELLAQAGYRYDSSLNPFTAHDRYGTLSGGIPGESRFVHPTGIVEFPMPMGQFLGATLPISGGGYFRLYPYALFAHLVRRHVKRTGLYIFYMHPWEADPEQPRTPVRNRGHRFRHYHGLSGTVGKLRRLLTLEGEKRTLREVLDREPL